MMTWASMCPGGGQGGRRPSRAHFALWEEVSLPARPACTSLATFVVVVPASRVVVLQDLGRVPGVEDVVHLVLLAPGQRLAHDLSGFVDVEVPGA